MICHNRKQSSIVQTNHYIILFVTMDTVTIVFMILMQRNFIYKKKKNQIVQKNLITF